tara:strand:- start:403 stop:711 length:309 start_codon:yes stop_codon:yes gene_type:complete
MRSVNGSDPAEYFVAVTQGTDISTISRNVTTKTSTGGTLTAAVVFSIRGVYCRVAGDIKMTDANGDVTEFTGLIAGATYPVSPASVATSTSGTDAILIALYG